jgi:hypothetical protein
MTPPTRTRYGTTHPERVDNELWEMSIRKGWSGYDLSQHRPAKRSVDPRHQKFWHSSYRDSDPGPFWSWQRFGRTSTKLPDGRIIHIAGEHEDSYDADFCIYNDVVVEHPDGRYDFYLYPMEAFPPTDFHSATLIGDEIFLIGSLGYQDLRRVGETQVLKLDTRTLRIVAIQTTGDGPGWISDHTAERTGETTILVISGDVTTDAGLQTNTGIFELDVATGTWQRRDHADPTVFPLSDEIYRRCKNPRYGMTNPERSENPFWLEMARRQWLPSRARLHFGDFATKREHDEGVSDDGPTPEIGTPEFAAWMARLSARVKGQKLARSIDDVVWTSAREGSLKVTLPDGRRLLIGGEVTYYGDEGPDSWSYNDIIVTHPDGAIEILTYPQAVFPHLYSEMADALHQGSVYIFGIIDQDRQADRPRGLAVLRLDTESYKITEMPAPVPPANFSIYDGATTLRDGGVVFPLVRQHDTDPELGIMLDLETLTWSAPFLYSAPPRR